MAKVQSPAAKKPRLDDTLSRDSKENDSSNDVTADDNVIVIDEEDLSVPNTPKTPKTPGSKRKFDAEREEKRRQREADKKAAEEKKLKEKEEREAERARQKQAKLDEKQKKEDERRQREYELQAKREQRQQEEEAAKKAKEEERLRRKAEKEEEQRKAKEDKQRAAEEKKRIQEEEKKKAEEEAEKKRKAQQIDKFCVKQVKPERQVIPAPSDHWLFSAFEIKGNMTLAPVHRRPPLSLKEKQNLLNVRLVKSDYLQKLPQRPVTKVKPLKAKLFEFHCSYRPPYYGTWRKRSKIVNGRRPFAKDTTLDYDYESDQEWEEEEEGDECKSEEEEGDEEENDEEDDGFFVEHGYLSSDEGDSEECKRLPNETEEDRTRRLKERAEEWKIEQKAKQRRNQIKKLVANEYGPCFTPPGDDIPDFVKKNLHVGILLHYIN